MRKLAPSILFASITALMGTTAFAAMGDATSPSTDKVTGSPTVDDNSANPQGMSYSDKSSTSPGTNARIDATTTERSRIATEHSRIAMDAHHKAMAAKARKHKAKMAKDGDLDTTDRLPLDSSNGAVVNSTTGTSSGR